MSILVSGGLIIICALIGRQYQETPLLKKLQAHRELILTLFLSCSVLFLVAESSFQFHALLLFPILWLLYVGYTCLKKYKKIS